MTSCSMRRLTETDLELVLKWRNHPAVRKNMYTQHEITLQEHVRWFHSIKDSNDVQYFIFEIDAQPVGVINFSNFSKQKYQAMWGFYSGDLEQKGVGKLMETHALRYAFEDLGLEKLNCEVLSCNLKVVNFHRKFGFSIEGVFKNHFVTPEGESQDIYRLAITKSEWKRSLLGDPYIRIGERYTEKFKVTDKMVTAFAEATGDFNPIHFNVDAAQKAGFRFQIAHGILSSGLISKILGTNFPGPGTVYLNQNIEFLKPIYVGDEIEIEIKAISGIGRKLTFTTTVSNSEKEVVLTGESTVLVAKK